MVIGSGSMVVPSDVGFCSTAVVVESKSSKPMVVESVTIGVVVSAGGVVVAVKMVVVRIVTVCVNELIYNS